MEPIPPPSTTELLLQLLERQTISAVNQNPARDQVNQLIITLHKAAAQQKHLEET